MILAGYLRAEAARPFAFGAADCVTLLAGWVRACRGGDPLAWCRPYTGQGEADERLRELGGLPRAVGRGLRHAGLRMTREPQPGDVAVIAVAGIAACAIRTERGWVWRHERGLVRLPSELVRVIAAWRV